MTSERGSPVQAAPLPCVVKRPPPLPCQYVDVLAQLSIPELYITQRIILWMYGGEELAVISVSQWEAAGSICCVSVTCCGMLWTSLPSCFHALVQVLQASDFLLFIITSDLANSYVWYCNLYTRTVLPVPILIFLIKNKLNALTFISLLFVCVVKKKFNNHNT